VGIEIDESRAPLVLVRFVGDVSDAQFERYLAELGAHVRARRGKTVTIFDMTLAPSAPGAHRQRQALWVAEHAEALARTSLGSVFVVRSTVMRAALTAILWAQPLPQPHVCVATLAEGEAWARDRLRGAGVAFP
jgi:hypothetical protein